MSSFPHRWGAFLYGRSWSLYKLLICFVIATTYTIKNAQAEPLVIVALGDSLTQGYGIPVEEGFTSQLQDWLNAKDSNVTLINAGVSGDTTAGGRSRIEWTLSPEVDAVIVALGGNDMMRGLMPSDSRQNLSDILNILKSRELPTLLVGLPSPANFGPDYKTEYDAIFPDLAQEFSTLLYPDFFHGFREELSDPTALSKYMQSDAIHPNARGIEIIVEDIGPHVLELAKKIKQ